MLRDRVPVRSAPEIRSAYAAYKPTLRIDFDKACGYCDTPDSFLGGKSVYHVEHFAPHSKFPLLKIAYSNLIYACPFCNRSKSNTWIGSDASISHNDIEGFVDPCSVEYEIHLDRSADGRFLPRTPVGAYMIKHLKLNLIRHQFVWQSKKIRELRDNLRAVKSGLSAKDSSYLQLLEAIDELTILYDKFRDQIVDA
ncbi:HNH endonuclease [Asticcacaulis tiandongensis]|uniref:HNH endonuclease n=1 Tax=Asticcacaulis tiandongensis TaxID=2565365 RepID=UPI001127BC65